MPARYLVDTCVWGDFYEDRISKSGKPLGKYASEFFMEVIKSKDKILFSEALTWELKKDYGKKGITDLLNLLVFNGVLVRVEIQKEEYSEAKELSAGRNIPFVDCINAVQARNNNAILVSQDKHFFEKLSDVVKCLRPQDIN